MWSFKSFPLSILTWEMLPFPPRFCFWNLKCTIRGCTISWRVVGYGLIFGGGGYWCEKHFGQKENHYFTRLEIMVVTKVYCEKLLKLFDFSGRVVWMPHPVVLIPVVFWHHCILPVLDFRIRPTVVKWTVYTHSLLSFCFEIFLEFYGSTWSNWRCSRILESEHIALLF